MDLRITDYISGISMASQQVIARQFIPTASLINGQVLYCLVTSDASCGLAKSNSIPIAVYPPPSVTAGQLFQIAYGQSIKLTPAVTGNIASYNWTPATGLSDSTIPDPVADPATTTVYTLTITAENDCKASGAITVYVYTPAEYP
jgi:hypothetical protein